MQPLLQPEGSPRGSYGAGTNSHAVSDNRHLAGPVLSVVAGVVIAIVGAIEISVGEELILGVATSVGALGVLAGLGITITGAFGFEYPESHTGLGVIVLLLAILSLTSDIGVGFLLAVLGGTCLIVFGPEDWPSHLLSTTTTTMYSGGVPENVTPPGRAETKPFVDKDGRTHIACHFCRTVNPIQMTFCSTCGAQLRP